MFDIQEELKKLPEKPGVYIMKDASGDIIYVGKAVVLKNRVRQYFQSGKNLSAKTQAMAARITGFEYIVTDSEVEALILECNLIKRHRPRYNILLKDDKSYPYIKVTLNEEYPRIIMTRKYDRDGARYFGPYTSANAVRETIDTLKKFFPIKSCSKALPRDIGKSRPCLNYHICQCMAPCQGDINKDSYRSMMKDVCTFLGGKQEELIRKLEEKMKEAAANTEFEKAAELRDRINSLKLIAEKQKIISGAVGDEDVIAFASGNSVSCVQIFFIRSGKLIGREHFILDDTSGVDQKELISSFLGQFYSEAAFVPGEIVLQEDIDELNMIESWLSGKKGSKVHIRVPMRGDKLKLVEMVSRNALMALNQFEERIKREGVVSREGLESIAAELGLASEPRRIEAYDVSNTGETEMVSSMVVFENGKPDNREYRRFKIKWRDTPNDYVCMQETLYRRFVHAEKEAEELKDQGRPLKEGKFTRLPDLILVDGGLGHVNAVQNILDELSIAIPVWGMVKDGRHNTRGLVSVEKEIDLSKNIQLLRFVTAMQDEAHRFALEYNRKLRGKRQVGSVLDEIEGIGPSRKKALLKAFGSVNRIKQASLEDLAAVEGMSRSAAQKVHEYFH